MFQALKENLLAIKDKRGEMEDIVVIVFVKKVQSYMVL